MKLYQKFFTVIFMAAIIVFAIFNYSEKKIEIKTALWELDKPESLVELQRYTDEIDEVLCENLVFDENWNEMYATAYSALFKNEENGFEYVRDKNGVLYSGNFENTSSVEVREIVKRINVIRKKVEDEDTKVVVLLYPCKYNEEWSDGYWGIPYSDYNYLIDDITSYFRYYSIHYIDYRQFFIENQWEINDIFYNTDPHWKTTAAFSAYQKLAQYLNREFDEKLDMSYTYKSKYDFVTYEKSFLGAQGRSAGIAYSGLDDFTLITPKFNTNYTYKYINNKNISLEKKGDIFETLIDLSVLNEENYYNRDLYKIYMETAQLEETIINHNNKDGLKVLFLRDSFSAPLSVFLSSHCSAMELLWSSNVDSKMMEEKIEEKNYDYVFIGMSVDEFAEGGFEIYVDEVLTNE